MVSLFTFYLCQNMKLFANKLAKLPLSWFFNYSFTKKKIFHLPSSGKTLQKSFYVGQGCQTFTNSLKLKNIKSHKSCGHHLSLIQSSDKKTLGIGNFIYLPWNRVKKRKNKEKIEGVHERNLLNSRLKLVSAIFHFFTK